VDVQVLERQATVKPMVLTLVVICIGWAVGPATASAQDPDATGTAPTAGFERSIMVGFNVLAHTGLWVGEVPGRPVGSTFMPGGGDRYTGYGFGINIDYHMSQYLTAHFDITRSMLSTPVAYAAGYAHGWWIESASNFTVDQVGPFQEDVNYWRNATGIRVGLRAYLARSANADVWAGIYQGFYTWEIQVLNDERTSTYGDVRGSATGLSLLNVGVDLWNSTRTFGSTVSFESGSPLTGDYSIEDCLISGWNYDSLAGGEHLFGPLRMAVSFNFVSPKKK
jgi:hypothetical protein